MKPLAEITLKSGKRLQILRFDFPGENDIPDWLEPLFQYQLPHCWHDYYGLVYQGRAENCCNHLYAGLVDGIPAGRMWFGYSTRTGAGNFGNVMTMPDFRRQGIMNALLRCLADDFQRSSALFCSCDAAPTAAPAYESVGFRRIFGENLAPMAIVHNQEKNFGEIVKFAYESTSSATVRPGTLCDRFDCDKLLAYDSEVYGKVARCPEIPDYLTLWPMVTCGKAKVNVLEATSGFCAGYAFRHDGQTHCVLHPRFESYRGQMLKSL